MSPAVPISRASADVMSKGVRAVDELRRPVGDLGLLVDRDRDRSGPRAEPPVMPNWFAAGSAVIGAFHGFRYDTTVVSVATAPIASRRMSITGWVS